MGYGNLNTVTPNAGGGRMFADVAYRSTPATTLGGADAKELLGFITNSSLHETTNSEDINYLGQGGSTVRVQTTKTPDDVVGTIGAAIDDKVQETIEMLDTWHNTKVAVGVNQNRRIYQIDPIYKADGTVSYSAKWQYANCSGFKRADNSQANYKSYDVTFTTSGSIQVAKSVTYNEIDDTFTVDWDGVVEP